MSLTVLHAIPSLVGGGAERQLSLLAPELCRLGVDTHVAYVRPGVNLAALRASRVHLHPIASSGNHDPRILFKLVQLIRESQPAIVQTWLPQMDILGGVAARLTRTPFVLSERSSEAAYRGGWKNRLRRLVGQYASVVVANSDGGVGYWRAGANDRRVIRNGLALRAIRSATPAAPETLGLPANARIILFAGRLTAEKNAATLLEALDPVLERHPDCAAVLFGEGPLRTALLAQIQTMRARDRVRLEAYTLEIWRWMRRASAFVSVSHFEGQPNTVLEAMASGCPLVVSDIDPHREILDDTMARFCNPRCARDIAHAIVEVLGESEIGAKRAALAGEVASGSSIESAARAYLSLYLEMSSKSVSFEGRTSL
jgi:glycosyltransferase involved in cell wall biosynthesis